MKCYIYRCARKEDMYLYLAEKDDFSSVPQEIVRSLGNTEFAMELELSPDRKLASEDPTTVITHLSARGFHLQLPRETSVEAIMARIAKAKR
jgi:uncharacterized protein YcgL (UPF0745 family)